MPDPVELVEQLRRDGFVFFRDFFPPALVNQARAEVLRWYQADLEDRARKEFGGTTQTGPAGKTILTEPSHLMIDAYGKSPALDQLVDQVLTDPLSSKVLERMAGKHIKFRGYNIRRMTGKHDPAPKYPRHSALPHEWHRDSPGEMGIGLFLTDVPEGGNSGTALMAGSHLHPYCPRWHALLSDTYYVGKKPRLGLKWLTRFTLFNRLLAKRLMRSAKEATGVPGDFFFFYNDTWHGRYPNVQGRESIIVLIGAFASEFPFPDKVTSPPADVIAALPSSIRACVTPDQPHNTDTSALVYWMLANRQPLRPMSLFALARLERRFFDGVNLALLAGQDLFGWLLGPVCRFAFRLARFTCRSAKKFLSFFRGRATPAPVSEVPSPPHESLVRSDRRNVA